MNLGEVRADENALWSLGAHDVAVLLDLVGERPVEAQARGECYVRPGVEDVVFGYLKFPSGVVAHLHLSWLDPHKTRKLTVVGSQKMVVFDDMETDRKVTIYDKSASRAAEHRLLRRVRERALRRHLDPAHPQRRAAAARVPGVRRRHPRGPRRRAAAAARASRSSRCSRRMQTLARRGRPRRAGSTRMTPARRPARPEPARRRRRRRSATASSSAPTSSCTTAARSAPARVVGDNAVLGKRPALGGQSTAQREPLPGLAIGERCTISTGAIVFAGSALADGVIVGDLAVVRERVTIGARQRRRARRDGRERHDASARACASRPRPT